MVRELNNQTIVAGEKTSLLIVNIFLGNNNENQGLAAQTRRQ